MSDNLLIALYVIFGMMAGGPVWLLFLSAAGHEQRRWERERQQMRAEAKSWQPRRQRQQWRVVDSVCKRLGVDHDQENDAQC